MIVAVLDTGVDYNHNDIRPNLWWNPGEVYNGYDDDGNGIVDDLNGVNYSASPPNGNFMDDGWHGTHCAGTIAAVANNGWGIAGIAGYAYGKVCIN